MSTLRSRLVWSALALIATCVAPESRAQSLLDDEWTVIKTINPPSPGIYFWSPEPLVHNGKLTARMVAERARALTRPIAAELPVIERLLDAVAGYYETEAKILGRHLQSGELTAAAKHAGWPSAAAATR